MKKTILIILVTAILFGGLFVVEYFRFNDGKLHIIFCDVGQGDAILVRTPNGKHVLIDGGPDRRVLNCLANNMPFWERTIDVMILTHPHADHFIGMSYVLERYNITHFATEKLENKSGEFGEFKKILKDKSIRIKYVSSGDKWRIPTNKAYANDVVLSVLGPTKEFLSKTSPNGNIGDSKEFASLVMKLSYGNFDAVFTGDTQAGELGDIVEYEEEYSQHEILQAPHHGSRTGLTKDIVSKLNPQLVVISVGALNRYKHPSKQILDLLTAASVPVLRTDQVGDIEIVVDEKGWIVKNN